MESGEEYASIVMLGFLSIYLQVFILCSAAFESFLHNIKTSCYAEDFLNLFSIFPNFK